MFGRRWLREFPLYRASVGSYVSKGRAVEPDWRPDTLKAVIHPAKPDAMSNIQLDGEDDLRVDGGIFIYTTPDTRLLQEKLGQKADLVEFNRELYRVVDEGDYSHLKPNRLAHFKYLALRTELTPEELC